MIQKLDVFDFDNTLFKSPTDTQQNRQIFKEKTGFPWIIDKEMSRELTRKHKIFVGMRKGWFGRAETLEPPLVPKPAPKSMFITKTCEAFLKSKADPNTLTLLLTGRHAGIQGSVLRILYDGNLVEMDRQKSDDDYFYTVTDPNVTCWFMGQNGPQPTKNKPTATLPWKIWIIEQYMKLYSDAKSVEFWEDREEHVDEFNALNGLLAEEVIVNFIDGQ